MDNGKGAILTPEKGNAQNRAAREPARLRGAPRSAGHSAVRSHASAAGPSAAPAAAQKSARPASPPDLRPAFAAPASPAVGRPGPTTAAGPGPAGDAPGGDPDPPGDAAAARAAPPPRPAAGGRLPAACAPGPCAGPGRFGAGPPGPRRSCLQPLLAARQLIHGGLEGRRAAIHLGDQPQGRPQRSPQVDPTEQGTDQQAVVIPEDQHQQQGERQQKQQRKHQGEPRQQGQPQGVVPLFQQLDAQQFHMAAEQAQQGGPEPVQGGAPRRRTGSGIHHGQRLASSPSRKPTPEAAAMVHQGCSRAHSSAHCRAAAPCSIMPDSVRSRLLRTRFRASLIWSRSSPYSSLASSEVLWRSRSARSTNSSKSFITWSRASAFAPPCPSPCRTSSPLVMVPLLVVLTVGFRPRDPRSGSSTSAATSCGSTRLTPVMAPPRLPWLK